MFRFFVKIVCGVWAQIETLNEINEINTAVYSIQYTTVSISGAVLSPLTGTVPTGEDP